MPAGSESRAPDPLLIAGITGGAVALVLVVGIAAFLLGRSGSDDRAADVPVVEIPANLPARVPAVENAALDFSAVREPSPVPVATSPSEPASLTPPEPEPQPTTAVSEPAPQPNLADLIETIEPSVVRIDVETARGGGNGSGFVVDKAGVVVTNYHVIAEAQRAKVVFADGTMYPVIGSLKLDPTRDIAVLQVQCPADRLHPIPLAAAPPRKGETVLACGAPLGLSFTVSQGIISAIRSRDEIRALGIDHEGTWIQTTTPISPGNSGGPLVNMKGEVVGANTLTLTDAQNLNFAVSSIDILDAVQTRAPQPVALRPTTLPRRSGGSGPEQVVDALDTDRGRTLLGEMKEITFMIASFSYDPTGNVEQLLKKVAENTVEQVGLKVTGSQAALMLVTMAFDRAATESGSRRLMISAHVLVRDSSQGSPQIVKVWEDRAIVGTFSSQSFKRGQISTPARAKVLEFFNKFKADHQAAVASLDAETADETKDDGDNP